MKLRSWSLLNALNLKGISKSGELISTVFFSSLLFLIISSDGVVRAKEFSENSKEILFASDDIINGGVIPLNEQKIKVKCDSGNEEDDSLISSKFKSDSDKCIQRNIHRRSNRAELLLREIQSQEILYDSAGDVGKQINICASFNDVILKDLLPFTGGITKDLIDAAAGRGVLYQIVKGKLYRQHECNFPNRCSGVEHFLAKLAATLPDMEFVINVSDWPQIPAWSKSVLPVFSFSKSSDYADILYPAWTFWEGGPSITIYPKGIGRWDKMRQSLISKSNQLGWAGKKSIAFFRGSRTSSDRDRLVLLSRKEPELVDAQYTKNQAWKSERDTLNYPAAAEVSLEDHCNYKYLFNYRGVAASFRFKHLFLCRSLVFHVGKEWIEFFYPALKPWVHYVPVEQGATEEDLKFLISFFQTHDDVALRISKRGYQFIKDNLALKHVHCYWEELLRAYADLLHYIVQRRDDVVLIPSSQKN